MKQVAFNNEPTKYRIGVINDFNDAWAYLEYLQYGTLYSFAACCTNGKHRGYQIKEDAIYVFLNFEKVLVTTSKAEARACLDRLIEECPKACKRDFSEHKATIYKSLGE